MAYKILIIEDDAAIRGALTRLLTAQGYAVTAPAVFTEITALLKKEAPQLVLLDITLPETSGFAICAEIRAFSQVPIVFVTSASSDAAELESILLGGDAFISKPFNTAILLAKIASLLRRAYPENGSEVLSWHGATLHPETSTLHYEGREAELTKNELKILYYLFKHAGNICARADIIDFLWDNQLYVDDNTLSVNINRIRHKLAEIGLDDFIQTKHRQGYLL